MEHIPFIPLALIREARGMLREQIQIGVDAIDRTPVRQRTADDRTMRAKGRHDVEIYDSLDRYWDAGIYPTCVDGVWQMESSSRAGTMHHIWRDTRASSGWRCDCWHGERGGFHVHQAAMLVIELALDLADRYDHEATPAAPQPDIPPDYTPAVEVDDDPFLPDHTARIAEAAERPAPTHAATLLARHFDLVETQAAAGHTMALYRDPKIGGPKLSQPHWLVIDGGEPTRYRHYEAARGAWLALSAEWTGIPSCCGGQGCAACEDAAPAPRASAESLGARLARARRVLQEAA